MTSLVSENLAIFFLCCCLHEWKRALFSSVQYSHSLSYGHARTILGDFPSEECPRLTTVIFSSIKFLPIKYQRPFSITVLKDSTIFFARNCPTVFDVMGAVSFYTAGRR